MEQIVIFNNECNGTTIDGLIDQLSLVSGDQAIIVIGNYNGENSSRVTNISLENQSFIEATSQALENISAENDIVFLSAQNNANNEEIKDAVTALLNAQGDINTCSIQSGKGEIELAELSCDNLIREISFLPEWPLALISVKAQFAKAIEEAACPEDFIGQILVHGLAAHASFSTNAASVSSMNCSAISQEIAARLLQSAVNTINIEELFPNHAWETHQEESAAACYHTLAAAFIRLNDFDTATQCLAFGDRLEDSPRSLALKGIIALNKGETLNAVANMVSSLQEYERRKMDSKEHYLSFMPKDLEQINTSLQSGLSALNERDNDTAVNFFANAVFNFDSFYSDCGLEPSK